MRPGSPSMPERGRSCRKGGGLHVSPEGSLRIEAGDLIVVLGSAEQMLATAAKVQ